MLKVFFALIALSGPAAFATVDGHDTVSIVVQNIQDPEDFLVQSAPIVGCYGLPQGARLAQWTMEYKATQNIGCGGPVIVENINYLTCAKVVKSKESNDFASYKEIVLDISKCDQKNNPKFITMLRTTAARNFPQSDKSEVVLTLQK